MSTNRLIEPAAAYALCRDCATNIYGARKPTEAYAFNTARLLAMTAAHESGGFRFNRQRGFSMLSRGGAFGLWQVQENSVVTSLGYLQKRPDVSERAGRWLFREGSVPATWWARYDVSALLLTITGWPRMGCLFARLHYLWFTPHAIPAIVPEMAKYAKLYFNTTAGSATAQDYLEAYERWIAPIFEDSVDIESRTTITPGVPAT